MLIASSSFNIMKHNGACPQILPPYHQTFRNCIALQPYRCIHVIAQHTKTTGQQDADVSCFIDRFAEHLEKQKYEDITQLIDDVKLFLDNEYSQKIKMDNACNILIKHCCRIGKIELSLGILEQMKKEGINLSAVTFEPVIKLLSSTFHLSQAEALVASMRGLGLCGTFVIFDSLVRAYAKSDNIEKAYNTIAEMHMAGMSVTASIYSPIIQAYGKKGCIKKAFDVLRQMEVDDVSPTSETYGELLRVCASLKQSTHAFKLLKRMKKQGIEPCKNIISALVTLHAKCGNLDKAKKILLTEEQSGKIDVKALSAVLAGLAENGDIHAATGLLDYMRQRRLWPSFEAFNQLLSAVGHSGDLCHLFQLFENFRQHVQQESKLSQDEKNNSACITIIVSCIQHNQLGKMVNFLQLAQSQSIADIEILCTKVLLHNDASLSLEKKIAFVNAMWEHLHMMPSRLALEALLVSCARNNDGEKACQVLDVMWRAKLQFSIFTLLILFRTFVGAEDEEKAEKVFVEIKKKMDENGSDDEDVKWLLAQILKPFHEESSCVKKREHMSSTFQRLQELGKKWWGGTFGL